MTDRAEKIRSRFGWGWSGWNHPLRAQIAAVFLILFGTATSIALQTVLAHRGTTFFEHYDLYGDVVSAAFVLAVTFVGLAVLALAD